jgi:hypothetical protein
MKNTVKTPQKRLLYTLAFIAFYVLAVVCYTLSFILALPVWVITGRSLTFICLGWLCTLEWKLNGLFSLYGDTGGKVDN